MVETPAAAPSRPAAESGAVVGVVRTNISALMETRRKFLEQKTLQERAADRITAFAGSMRFVYVHAAFYGLWLLVNTGTIRVMPPFDPFPFVMLAMIASVEAIFLSTFVLISQNRMSDLAAQTADLHLHVSLLAEHEITRLVRMVDAIADKVGAPTNEDKSHLNELKQDVRPEAVIDELSRTKPASDL
jgi:uncharacterized membrane protein